MFGVRADLGKRLKRGEYGFQEFTGGRLENSIVAHIGTVVIDGSKLDVMANSYAAPVVTGEIIGILKNESRCSYKGALRQLIQRGAKEGHQGRKLQKYLSNQGKEISTPILGIDRRCGQLKKYIKERLQADGYHVITSKMRGRIELKSKEDIFVSGDCQEIYEHILDFFRVKPKKFKACTMPGSVVL